MSRPVIRVGRTTTILGERFIAHNVPHMPREEQAAWWQRTDYGWTCSACPTAAGIWWPTFDGAWKAAEKHGDEHGGATIEKAS